jgi:hypothetical protein
MVSQKYDCKKIIIQSGENNDWINKPRKELSYDEYHKKTIEVELDQPHLSLDIAQKIYDTFAFHLYEKNILSRTIYYHAMVGIFQSPRD